MVVKCIIDLLNKNRRIVVPGLGMFLYRDENSKNVSFNNVIKINDWKLINTISSEGNISKEQAAKKIHEFIDDIKKKTESGKKYDLNNLGYFYKDATGLKFTSAGASSPTTTRKTKAAPVSSTTPTSGGTTLSTPSSAGNKPSGSTQPVLPKKEEPIEDKSGDMKSIIISIVIPSLIVIGLIVAGIIYKDEIKGWFDSKSKTVKVKKKPITVKEKTEAKPNNNKTITEEPKKKTTQPRRKKINKPSADEFSHSERRNQYHVVAGFFNNRQRASKFAQKLNAKQLETDIIVSRKGKFYVTVGSAKNKTTAIKMMDKPISHNIDVWILYY